MLLLLAFLSSFSCDKDPVDDPFVSGALAANAGAVALALVDFLAGAMLAMLVDILLALLSLALSESLEKSFHFRQPSKSMRACMHPHSLTLRSSQTKFTGCRVR